MNNEQQYNYLLNFLTDDKIEKFSTLIHLKTEYILPVFEDIYQFRNAAAIVRSLEGLGVNKMVALEGKNFFKPEESVSRGAEKWLKIERKPHTLESLLEIKSKGYSIVSVSPEKDALDIENVSINKPIALIFGTEWEGVSQEVLDISDACVKIPMYGFTQSYNVSVATAISVYSLMNRIRNSEIKWQLSEEYKLEMQLYWAKNSIQSSKLILDKHNAKN